MKMLLISLISLVCIIVDATGQRVNFDERPVRITGKIINYEPDSSNAFISFKSYRIDGRSNDTAVAINEDGSFAVSIMQAFPCDMLLQYKADLCTVYGSPGDNIYLELNEQNWKQAKDKSAALYITGETAQMSVPIMQWEAYYHDHQPSSTINWEDRSLSDEEFTRQRLFLLSEQLGVLQQYLDLSHAPTRMATWARNSLRYDAAFEIVFHAFSGKVNTSLHDTALMRLVSDFGFPEESSFHNSYYYRYLQMLLSGFQIIVNVNPAYENAKKSLGKNPVPLVVAAVEKHLSGMQQQLGYYLLFTMLRADQAAAVFDSFKEKLSNKYLRKALTLSLQEKQKPFVAANIKEKILAAKVDDAVKTRFISLLDQWKDRYVFIDFWGSWCGPCMIEMPHYPELIDSLKGKPVHFVFMAVETNPEKVEEVKKAFAGNASFLTLTDNETRLANNIFGFTSYPSHFLLSPGGKLENFSIGGIANNSGLSPDVVRRFREAIK